MRSIISIVLCIVMLVLSSGCVALHQSMKASTRDVEVKEAIASGADEAAVKAIKVNGGVGLGLDVYSWKAFMEHPVRNSAAGVLDAALAYGLYEGLQSLSQSIDVNVDSGTSISVSDSTDVTVTVSGDTDNTDNSVATETDNSGNGNSRSTQ